MNELSLFSGYGGYSLALQILLGREGVRTIGYCEIEPYCQEILKARIRDGALDDAPIWPDIRAADFSKLRGLVDIVTAGFPCQPHSVAGKRAGALDKRNLWPDTLRVIDDVGPAIVLLENVPGILANGYAGIVVGELAERGYDAFWGLLSAASVGAPHVRTRWWCVAYPNRFRAAQSGWRGDCLQAFRRAICLGGNQENQEDQSAHSDDSSPDIPHNDGAGQPELQRQCSVPRPPGRAFADTATGWPPEPNVGRVADGTPRQLDRLKAIGNGIVPAQAAEALKRLCLLEAVAMSTD